MERLILGGAVGLERNVQRKLFQTVHRVSEDFNGRWHFNTSIAALMELVNELYLAMEHEVGEGVTLTMQSGPALPTLNAEFLRGVFEYLVRMLAPFAPHLAQELWETLGEKENLLRAPWPKYDPALAKEDEIEIPVQINGKLRARIVVPADATEDTVRTRALAEEKVKGAIAGKQIMKVIIVPLKLVNVVVR
jgi:leucyl-tRNA synthetase